MPAAPIVDLDLAMKLVPLVVAVAVLVAPALYAATRDLDHLIEKAGTWTRHGRQRNLACLFESQT